MFIAITASFYANLAAAVSGLDPSSPQLRATISPLNPAPDGSPQELVDAVRSASADAFRLAMLVGAGLLIVGAAVDYVGLRETGPETTRVTGRDTGPAPATAGERATIPRTTDGDGSRDAGVGELEA